MSRVKKTLHMPSFPLMCVCVREGYTLTHSYTLTTMPTCLSIRFYHHRDTVDSSFVRPEKTGALRSQTTTFTVICKGCGYASVCVRLCSSGTQRKRSRMWTIGETKSLCVCFGMWESVHSSLHAFVPMFWCSWHCVSCLTHWGQWVLCFRERKRSNINSEPLCYQQSQSVRQQAPLPLQKWTGPQTLNVREAEWMVEKCQHLRKSEKQSYF